jgi:hypothetical protein
MRLKEVITAADEQKPNAFTNEQKTRWINDIEGKMQTEIFLFAPPQVICYTYEKDKNCELLADPPHDQIYISYLNTMIDFANGEYDRYGNTQQLFNSQYKEFMRWFAQNYRPADMMEDHV